MKRTAIIDTPSHIGKEVLVKGWVQGRRDHGKIVFIDLRDFSGVIQVIFWIGSDTELFRNAEVLRDEYVVAIKGVVQKRNGKQANTELATGMIELAAKSIKILNKSETPTFSIEGNGHVSEDTRMEHRYLDLRTSRMKDNLTMRHRITKCIRDELDRKGFLEIETPNLTKGTPEGAREYVVPSRLNPGKFFVLPQSPQQFKQLLMVGGVEKYFQIARCFRDEDSRGDRQAEFTQLDMELSFISQEDVMSLNEKLLIKIIDSLYPDKNISHKPFPRLSYKEVMEKYGTDRPDLRKDKNDPNELAFLWVIDFPFFEKTNKKEHHGATGQWTFTHNPFSAPIDEHRELLNDPEKWGSILATQYDIVLNGYEIGGGSIRNHNPAELHKVLEIIGYSKQAIDRNFGHILRAFRYGVPPHGGIAWGLDRLVMILQNEPSIRDVVAFPKTGDHRDLLMEAPSEVPKTHLRELNISSTAEQNDE